ncbi:MAG: hypothetical protein AAFQ16_10475 [Pseudomonadota bacterium]
MRSYSVIAPEGMWVLLAIAGAGIATSVWAGPLWSLPWVILFVFAILLFQDPRRELPLAPLSVLSPVDGTVLDVELCRSGLLDRQSLRIRIENNPLGAYTLRAPVEGRLLDPRDNIAEGALATGRGGMWLRTDEGDDVVVSFSGKQRFGGPCAMFRYGERVGHGQRCAYLRLVSVCEVYLPERVLPRVEAGQRVTAGQTVLAKLRRELDEVEKTPESS